MVPDQVKSDMVGNFEDKTSQVVDTFHMGFGSIAVLVEDMYNTYWHYLKDIVESIAVDAVVVG
jgi:hypothetical protein